MTIHFSSFMHYCIVVIVTFTLSYLIYIYLFSNVQIEPFMFGKKKKTGFKKKIEKATNKEDSSIAQTDSIESTINKSTILSKIKHAEHNAIRESATSNYDTYINNPSRYEYKYLNFNRISLYSDHIINLKECQLDLIEYLSMKNQISESSVRDYKDKLGELEFARLELATYSETYNKEKKQHEAFNYKYDRNLHNFHRKRNYYDNIHHERLKEFVNNVILKILEYKPLLVDVTNNTAQELKARYVKVQYYDKVLISKRNTIHAFESKLIYFRKKIEENWSMRGPDSRNQTTWNTRVIDYAEFKLRNFSREVLKTYTTLMKDSYKYTPSDDTSSKVNVEKLETYETEIASFKYGYNGTHFRIIDLVDDHFKLVCVDEDVKISGAFKLIVTLYRCILNVIEGSARIELLDDMIQLFEESFSITFVQDINSDELEETVFNDQYFELEENEDEIFKDLDVSNVDNKYLDVEFNESIRTKKDEKDIQNRQRKEIDKIKDTRIIDKTTTNIENNMNEIANEDIDPIDSDMPKTRFEEFTPISSSMIFNKNINESDIYRY